MKEKIHFYSFMSVIAWEELHGVEIVARINHILEILDGFKVILEKVHNIEQCVEDILENVVCGVCNGSVQSDPESPPAIALPNLQRQP